ncbi:MAG: TetR/AcrR family transcriptional regulator, partial [Thiovulaceae bacterium]|nr:TetR/AcrR family transcriptional regulator [Sulfurimonadaceae bacterium]
MKKTLREKLIDEMFKALYYEGYHACNLNKILELAGTSKGGMYHHFDSKKTLALEALDVVLSEYIHSYWEKPLETSENPLQTLFERIDHLADARLFLAQGIDFKHGSPLNTMIQELAANDRDFAQLFQKLLKRWEAVIVLTFTKARKLMRIDINIEEAA